MKKTETIQSVTIKDIIGGADKYTEKNNFHVFKGTEIDKPERLSGIPMRIDHFVIVLALEGAHAHIRINLIDYHIEKNGLIVVPPNVIHEFTETENNDFIAIGFSPDFFANVSINRKKVDGFTFFSSNSNPHFQLSDEEAAVLYQLMLLLYDRDHAETAHPFKDEVIHHAFNLFMYELAALVEKHRGKLDFKLTRKEDILLSFLKVLPEHFKEERSVQFYANLLFITPKHLTKTIKELTTKTCGEFIDDMVIMEAKVLLNDSSLSIGNVADTLHFSDQFFFSKFFKNQTGLTPTEYRTKG
jgi:AraC-like DNA-binding protein